MEINSLLSAGAGAPSGGAGSSGDTAGLARNFDDFLMLLTTQLKYQSPLEPLDSSEFIAQLVQFSQVEQSIKSNKNLESLLALQSANKAVGALGFIGKTVEAAGSEVPLEGGTAKFAYTLAGPAAAATVAILDASGKVVFSATGETTAGRHELTWDGKDANGNMQPDGAYKLIVSARDADDQPVDLATSVVGRVAGIAAGPDGIVLSLGPVEVPADAVVSVIGETTMEAGG